MEMFTDAKWIARINRCAIEILLETRSTLSRLLRYTQLCQSVGRHREVTQIVRSWICGRFGLAQFVPDYPAGSFHSSSVEGCHRQGTAPEAKYYAYEIWNNVVFTGAAYTRTQSPPPHTQPHTQPHPIHVHADVHTLFSIWLFLSILYMYISIKGQVKS